MKITKFNDNWKEWVEKNAFALIWSIPETANTVTLSHDAMLEKKAHAGNHTGFHDGK